MKLNDHHGWRMLVYHLFYPGVLGSMIFDMADPMRTWSIVSIALIAITVTFILDYLHMIRDLNVENCEKPQPLKDFLIALLFCFSYFTLSHTTSPPQYSVDHDYLCLVGLFFLSVSHLIIVFYEIKPSQVIIIKDFVKITPFIICYAATIVIWCEIDSGFNNYILATTITSVCVSLIAYAFCVFSWEKNSSSPDFNVNKASGSALAGEQTKQNDLSSNHCQNNKHQLYAMLEPSAKTAKIAIQMLIGAGVLIMVILKLIFSIFPPEQDLWFFIVKHHPLEITGYALAVSACIELAYMLYTDGPDEAIDPLILGFSAAALIEISRENIARYEAAAIILVLTAGIGFLFWVRNRIADI